ncbi:MAG: helix-hairpin-helix domain-containing protein, partial [Saprospiraceae bacterium]|nr:helix-hairpin-helix domain-containing protein [Saprospiraceae bacterium]
ILGLKTKNEQLSRQVEESEEEEMEEAVLEVSNDRLRLLEQKMSRLESQNEHLGRELRSMKEKWPTGAAYTGQEEVPETIQPLERQKDIFQEKIIEPPPERDDLTVIEGIGPFLERKLNEQGIFNLEQIAEWKSAEISQVAREIQFFESRILEDNWVGQAQRLLRLKERTPDALPIKLDASFNPQDLQIIEGVGPKIEGLLKDAGIDTWEELAETDSDRLREILSAAGDRYRMHDPSTWPTQARLAANEDWKLLQEYQEQLKGGREIWEEE